ncbi:CASP-like protein 4D1 [Corylus avellana]|uniref:CASP-like protein 4D1 n=1 Tax=Corylus avellana TaxID=13451 RepID=UPI001E2092BC|nr:CASP-like protein 4D1 [Corylus avellana]
MASPAASRVAIFILRVLTFILLLISLIVLTTSATTGEVGIDQTIRIHFNDINAYRYMLAAIVIGFAYSLLQLAFSTCHLISGNRLISGDGGILVDFYSEKVISYLLATGAAAGFGVTKDMKDYFEANNWFFGTFYEKVYASASMLFLAFVCSAVLSVLYSYQLPKKV